jgi:ribosomal protein S18 acetylase RimI-like enzyme
VTSPDPGIRLRSLLPADAALYRDIRLEALQQSPEAFGSTFEAECAQPLTWFADRLDGSAVFGALRDIALLGVAGFFARTGAKEAHKGVLWGTYVRPDARRHGAGRQLVQAVLDHARQHVELVQLSAIGDNKPALRLYASLGFVEYGLEKNALKQDGQYFDEVLMAKALTPNPS